MFVTGLSWACHPVHSEAVSGVVGRADILCTVFCLMTLIKHRENGWTFATPLLATLAMLAKEQGVTVLAICLLWDLVDTRQSVMERRNSAVRLSRIAMGRPLLLVV